MLVAVVTGSQAEFDQILHAFFRGTVIAAFAIYLSALGLWNSSAVCHSRLEVMQPMKSKAKETSRGGFVASMDRGWTLECLTGAFVGPVVGEIVFDSDNNGKFLSVIDSP